MRLLYLIIAATGAMLPPPGGAQEFEAFRQMCSSYGFQPGTDAFAQCIQKLDAEARAQQHQSADQHCRRLAQSVRQWCSQSYPSMPGTAGFNCGQAQASYRKSRCG